MNNRKLKHFCAIPTAVLIIFLSFCLPVNAQQLDTLNTLNGYRRHNLFVQFLNSKSGKVAEVEKVSSWVRQNGDETEKKYLEYFKEMRSYESLLNALETKINAIAKYLDWGIKNNHPNFLAMLYYHRSEMYSSIGQFNKSMENSLYALDELKKDPGGIFFEQGWILYQIGMDFYKFQDYGKAQEVSVEAFRFYNSPATNPSAFWFVKGCSNLAGVSFLKNGNYVLAKNWLDTTLYYAEMHKDSNWIGIATGNLGNIPYLQKQYANAIPYFEKAIPFCIAGKLTLDNVAAFSTNLAYCYMKTGNKAAIPALLKQAAEANAKHHEFIIFNYLEYFKVAAAYYREEGNTEMTLRFTDSVNLYQKKIDEEFNLLSKANTEAKLAYRNKELENLVLKEGEKKDLLIRYGLIATLLLLSVIAVLVVKRQKLQHQLKKKKLELEMQMAEEELTLAITEIKDFTYHIMEKNQLIETYSDEIEKLKKQNTSITDEQLLSLDALRNTTVLSDKEWGSIKTLFEKIHPGYMQLLKSNAADFSPAEIRYLVFTKLDFTPNEKASMLGVGSDNIRNIRSQIKKKLNFEDSDEIEVWLKKLG